MSNKKNWFIVALLLFGFGFSANAGFQDWLYGLYEQDEPQKLGALDVRQERNINPATDSLYWLGTTTPTSKAWLGVVADYFYGDGSNLTGVTISDFGSQFYTYFSATTTDYLTEGISNLYSTQTNWDTFWNASTTNSSLVTLSSLSLPYAQISDFGSGFYTYFNATNTDALSEGSTNKYSTQTNWDTLWNASTTLSSPTSIPNLSITGSQVSDFSAVWDTNWNASTTLSSVTTLDSLISFGAVSATTTDLGNLSITGYLDVAGASASSTFSNGIDLTNGCFAIDGTCVGGSTSLTGQSLTKGYFLVGDDGGNSQATSTIFIDSTGNVGIGTKSPYSLLSLKGSSGSQLSIAQADTNYTELTVDASGNLTITPSGDTITIPDDNFLICAGDACQTTSISGTGNLVVETDVEIGGDYTRTCPTGYIWVSGSVKFGTMPGFCVMKYEAKGTSGAVVSTATGLPYVSISQENSRAECLGIGDGYHLISENEWMTIAEDIANTTINDMDNDAGLQLANGPSDANDFGNASNAVASITTADPVVSGCNLDETMEHADNNYSASSCEIRGTGADGSLDADEKGYYDTGDVWGAAGYVSGGENKSQLRTHVLSNGNVVWDIAGNVREWTDALIIGQEEPEDASPADEWLEYTAITKYRGIPYVRPPDDGWASANGIGKLYSYVGSGSTNTYAFRRSGDWGDTSNAGVFTLDLYFVPTRTSTHVGFRCAR